jgi:hypothetical protein
LLDVWDEGGMYESLPLFGEDLPLTKNFASWEYGQAKQATMWWIDEEMVELLLAAAPTIPDDVTPEALDLPAPAGLVVLGKPWWGVSADGRKDPVRVDAFMWGVTTLPPIRPGDPEDGVLALSLSAYQWAEEAGNGLGLYAPLGRSDWPFDSKLPECWEGLTESRLASFMEDRRVLAALVTLLAQPGLTSVQHHRQKQNIVQRQERAGVAPENAAAVKLVVLRRPANKRVGEPQNGQERHYSHRWPVRPHFVNQPYGPGSSLRKLILRGPYFKGPEDAPLLVKDEVNVWRR